MIDKSTVVARLARLKLNNNICDNITVTVMSNSMYPTLKRGQQVRVYPVKSELQIGEIVLYKHWDKSVTVHRIVDIRINDNLEKLYLTKGDNNIKIDPYTITSTDIIGLIK